MHLASDPGRHLRQAGRGALGGASQVLVPGKRWSVTGVGGGGRRHLALPIRASLASPKRSRPRIGEPVTSFKVMIFCFLFLQFPEIQGSSLCANALSLSVPLPREGLY